MKEIGIKEPSITPPQDFRVAITIRYSPPQITSDLVELTTRIGHELVHTAALEMPVRDHENRVVIIY